jgi:hypothetical protein
MMYRIVFLHNDGKEIKFLTPENSLAHGQFESRTVAERMAHKYNFTNNPAWNGTFSVDPPSTIFGA